MLHTNYGNWQFPNCHSYCHTQDFSETFLIYKATVLQILIQTPDFRCLPEFWFWIFGISFEKTNFRSYFEVQLLPTCICFVCEYSYWLVESERPWYGRVTKTFSMSKTACGIEGWNTKCPSLHTTLIMNVACQWVELKIQDTLWFEYSSLIFIAGRDLQVFYYIMFVHQFDFRFNSFSLWRSFRCKPV